MNDTTKIWVTNAGGGIGNHPKSETISAGGTKKFHARAVRDITAPNTIPAHFTDNANGTITDNVTGLIWQKNHSADTLTWEQALTFADTLTLNGNTDWRLPNIKEIQSINDENFINPSVNATYFPDLVNRKIWSSTTLPNQTTKAWYLQTQYGITTYDAKIRRDFVLCVRGNTSVATAVATENNSMSAINLYPNPAATVLMVDYNKTIGLNAKIVVVDLLGQMVFSASCSSNKMPIDVSSFATGIYFVKLITPDKEVCKKLIINR